MLHDKRLNVEGATRALLQTLEGQRISGGIRPEQLHVAPATNRNLPAEVSHSEVLGNEQLLTCRLLDGDHLVQVRADPSLNVSIGGSIHLEADPDGWRLFDEAGDAIVLPEHPPAETDEPQLPLLS